MATLPQLIEEDVRQLDEVLRGFVAQADAIAALVIDKGGFLLAHCGDAANLDLTTIGALASGAFMANQTIARLVNEKNFNSICQQGEKFSLFVMDVDEHCLLAVIFKSQSGAGVVKYYARQLAAARERNPAAVLDLSAMNVADPQEFFRKKST